jgi:class 3 adenylate cyclase/predicted ATPase
MFCDLVDSTTLGEVLDPEDLRDVIATYQAGCAAVVDRFGGHVAQYLGDGLLCYFTVPQAHEDDPERAVRAALGMLRELDAINPRLSREHGVRLSVRIGIHTGPVVVGAIGGGAQRENLALGHTVNVAARLQEVAEPETVVISSDTLRLVRGLFVTEDAGVRRLRGIVDPVEVHRVVRESGARSRFHVAAAAGLTPLVGRESELALLRAHWAEAREGSGRAVLVEGEPGIGKSRLVVALREQLAGQRHTWLECRGSPHHEDSALHLAIELLREALGVTDEQPAAERAARIERGLERAGLPCAEALPLLVGLLAPDAPEARLRPDLPPEVLRRRTFETLARWLFAWAALEPTVLVVEDLHWADPSSLELLGGLIEGVAAAPVLLVLTHRPEFVPPWPDAPHLVRLRLPSLAPAESAALVERVAKGEPLPADVVEQVVKRTDGVPLFVEELTKSVLEAVRIARAGEARVVPALAIPETLQDSLMARLDRLGPAKEVAQVAAVLGREFRYELLAAAAAEDGASLERGLERLVGAELLHQRGEPPDASYAFKHALIQEAARESLLKGTRRAWHARIARVLEESFPALVAAEPGLVARHCEEGALREEAITYYQRAAEVAMERSASAEAVRQLKRAIELLHTLPESPERDRRELALQVALGAPLVTSTAWAHSEVEKAHARARELCDRIGDAPQLFQVVRNLVTFYTGRAELLTARDLCARLLRLAAQEGSSAHRLLAHQQTGIVLYYLGQPVPALEHYEQALACYEPAEHRPLTPLYGSELGVFTRIWMAWALWTVGHADRALATSRQAIELARESGHAFSLAYSLLWGAVVHVGRREPEETRELSEEALAIGREHAFAFVQGGARLVRAIGLVQARLGEPEIGKEIEEFQQSIVQLSATGTVSNRPQILGYLAAAYAAARRYEQARKVLEGALASSKQDSQRYWDAELYRLYGELTLEQGGAAAGEAERLLRRAVRVARSQGARALELRAATSLCRLWHRQGRAEEARALLEPVYAAFTEGFRTRDLGEARALLDFVA